MDSKLATKDAPQTIRNAYVVADSLNTATGDRITTVILPRFPKVLLQELNTHRVFSRNAASSRAIPVEKMIQKTLNDPYIPKFTKTQKGMSGIEDEDVDFQGKCEDEWGFAMTDAIAGVRKLLELGCHKQNANRLLEPFVRVPVIITSTKWENFFNLRCHPEAHPDFREVAIAIRQAREESEPATLGVGQWHIPMFTDEMEDFRLSERKVIAIARCARVSYNNHDGTSFDYEKDLTLYKRLESSGHLSPFEHCALAVESSSDVDCRNFSGFYSHRALLEDIKKKS